jgi:hypothetical protein
LYEATEGVVDLIPVKKETCFRLLEVGIFT